MVDAAEEGIRKPAAAIYLRCAAALDTPPEACLFIDDLRVNVRGACAFGMQALRFDVRDPQGSVRRLLDRLGIPDAAAEGAA